MKYVFITLLSLGLALSSAAQDNSEPGYPSVSGYIGTAVPVLSLNENGSSFNFNSSTSLVFPVGINLNKSSRFSYSVELDPVITFSKDSSSVSNLALLPGVLLHQKNVTYGIRAAFETNGRYGLSFSLLKTIAETEQMNLVLGLPIDIRTGNGAVNSLGTGLILVVVL